MPSTVKYNGKSPEQRLADRLHNSGAGLGADHTVKHGEGARRTFHNIHVAGSVHGTRHDEEGDR